MPYHSNFVCAVKNAECGAKPFRAPDLVVGILCVRIGRQEHIHVGFGLEHSRLFHAEEQDSTRTGEHIPCP